MIDQITLINYLTFIILRIIVRQESRKVVMTFDRIGYAIDFVL